MDEVFYFDLVSGIGSEEELIERVFTRLLQVNRNRSSHDKMMKWPARREWIVKHLRSTRHLVVLDHVPDAPFPLTDVLTNLSGGRTAVLLASRTLPDWLNEIKTLEVYHLGGLDVEAAKELALVILERCGRERYRDDPNLPVILKHLAGHPGQMEMILTRLSRCTPSELRTQLNV